MNTKDLIDLGYEILNAKITNVDLSMADHGCITLNMPIEGSGWACCYGGICLGHGCLGADSFDCSPKSMEYIMRIMDVVGVERFSDLKGKYIRVATKSWGDTLKLIGNIIDDKWFDPESFFKNT